MLKAKQVWLYQLCLLGAGRDHPGRWDGSILYQPCLGWQMFQVTVAFCTSPAWAGRCSRSLWVGQAVVLCDSCTNSTRCHPWCVPACQNLTIYCSWWANGVV